MTELLKEWEADANTASRFYPQFTSLAECLTWLGRLVQ
jgi:hypothetical protein